MLSTTPCASATVQLPPVDEAVFVVRANDQVVGREEYALRRVTDPTGGLTLTVLNEYPHTAAIRTFARVGPRRVTIRIATITGETAREYPNRPTNLLADEWVLGLYALVAAMEPGDVVVVFPRTGTRADARLADRGRQRTDFAGTTREFRHLTLQFPDGTHHLWFDADGRLMKIAIPARNLVSERRLP